MPDRFEDFSPLNAPVLKGRILDPRQMQRKPLLGDGMSVLLAGEAHRPARQIGQPGQLSCNPVGIGLSLPDTKQKVLTLAGGLCSTDLPDFEVIWLRSQNASTQRRPVDP